MRLSVLAPILCLMPVEVFSAAIGAVRRRGMEQCGVVESQASDGYNLSTNLWGSSYGNGSQCSEIDGYSSSTGLSWSTTWSWAGSKNQVKSYTNVQTDIALEQLSAYQSMKTTWNWGYTGTNLSCNVAYDTFVGISASGTNIFEVMIWLGLYGPGSPLSANGYPFTSIANTTIGDTDFELAYGLNEDVKVYSFVATSRAATSYSGDLLDFYQYLEANYASNGFNSSLYLQQIQAGSEVFDGINAQFTTTAYTINVV